MNYELAKQLKDAGFPSVTRWEVENNYRRAITVTGQESLPPLGALLSMFDFSMGLDTHGKNYWKAYRLGGDENPYNIVLSENQEQDIISYRDDSTYNQCTGSTPEEAVAHLWLVIHKSLLGNEAGK